MKILKTDWIGHFEQHTRKAVYAVDICNDNEHVATGGIDGVVKIWSLSSIKECCRSGEKNFNSKALATMNRHSGAVTVVKFSPDGKYLATGSDDRIVLIWEKEGNSQAAQYMSMSNDSQTNAFAAEHNEEHWVVRRRLAAHDNDIQDLCWSPDSSLLVSVGLDRSIIVWNGITFEKIKKFDVHHSLVKGVIFDPANKYFATASDDRTVKVFRYHRVNGELNFSIEANITEPFKGSPITTYFRRLSWSPDGQHIAAPNASNGPVSTVAIINRGSWVSNVSLIGHTSPSEVARFNPRLFKKKLPDREVEYEVSEYEENEDEGVEEISDTSTDDIEFLQKVEKGKIIESRAPKRPKMIKKKVKKTKIVSGEESIDSILCSAGQDKTLTLWSTTQDRPIFTAYDIVSKSVTDACWNKDGDILIVTSLDGSILPIIFAPKELGNPIPLENNIEYLHRYGVGKETNTFPESIEQLEYEERALAERKKNKDAYQNIETAELSKRTTSLMQSSSTDEYFSKTTKEIPEDVHVNVLIPKRKTDALKEVTIQKNGKKRVSPTLISTVSSPNSKLLSTKKPKTIPNEEVKTKLLKKTSKKNSKKALFDGKISKQSYPIPRLGVHTLIMGIKDRPVAVNNDKESFTMEIDTINGEIQPIEGGRSSDQKDTRLTLNSKNSHLKALSADVDTRYLEYPTVTPDADCVLVEAGDSVDEMYILEIRNGVERSIQFDTDALFENPTKILGYYKGERTMSEMIPEVINCAIGSMKHKLWALSTTEGSLYLFSFSGRFLVPKISLGYKMVKLKIVENYLITLTETGLFYVFDISQMRIILNKISISTLLFDQDCINPNYPNKIRINKKVLDFKFSNDKLEIELLDTSISENNAPTSSSSSLSSSLTTSCKSYLSSAITTFQWNSDMGVWMNHATSTAIS